MHDGRKVLIVLHVLMLALCTSAAMRAEEPAVFPLTESSALDSMADSSDDAVHQMTIMYRVAEMQYAACMTTPLPGVVYPKLTSPAPLYGRLPLTTHGEEEEEIDFVIDESQPAAEPAEQEKPSFFGRLGAWLSGSKAPPRRPTKYDLLYVDLNRDRDLTNDPPLRPIRQRPKAFAAFDSASLVVFDHLDIKPVGEAAQAAKPVRMLPWLNGVDEDDEAPYLVVMTTGIRKGRIRIGQAWYEAVVGTSIGDHANLLVRREPSPDANPPGKHSWRTLGLGLQQVEGGFYELSTNPAGDQLTVARYTGPMGELRLEAGDRKVDEFAAAGVLQTATGSAVWLGEPGDYGSEQYVRTVQLPVGDYQIGYLTVACGKLLVRLSADYRSREQVAESTAPPSAFPIAIRADQAYVLNLSNEPTMKFVSPVANPVQAFRRGTKIDFSALLVDPAINSIVGGLDDATRKISERKYMDLNGQERTFSVYTSLAPQVSITNAAGQKVAGGPMPFG